MTASTTLSRSTKRITEYDKLSGRMTVTFRDKESTLQQAGRFLEEPARSTRQQVWLKSRHDPKQALANYCSALKLGGTRPLPALFAAANIHFDFSEKTLRPLMQALTEELSTLPQT